MISTLSKDAANALINQYNLSVANTKVTTHAGISIMCVHGIEIARKNWNGNNELQISNAGQNITTIKDRLNHLPNVSIQQKADKWYLNGEEWIYSKEFKTV